MEALHFIAGLVQEAASACTPCESNSASACGLSGGGCGGERLCRQVRVRREPGLYSAARTAVHDVNCHRAIASPKYVDVEPIAHGGLRAGRWSKSWPPTRQPILLPHGHWVVVELTGNAGSGMVAPRGWRPYSVWATGSATDQGWLWVARGRRKLALGATCYHYGRWHEDPR